MTCIPPPLSQFLPHLLSFWLWIKRNCKWYAVGWPPDCHIWLRNVSVHVSHACLFLASPSDAAVTLPRGTQWRRGSQTARQQQQTCVNQTHSFLFPFFFSSLCSVFCHRPVKISAGLQLRDSDKRKNHRKWKIIDKNRSRMRTGTCEQRCVSLIFFQELWTHAFMDTWVSVASLSLVPFHGSGMKT